MYIPEASPLRKRFWKDGHHQLLTPWCPLAFDSPRYIFVYLDAVPLQAKPQRAPTEYHRKVTVQVFVESVQLIGEESGKNSRPQPTTTTTPLLYQGPSTRQHSPTIISEALNLEPSEPPGRDHFPLGAPSTFGEPLTYTPDRRVWLAERHRESA